MYIPHLNVFSSWTAFYLVYIQKDDDDTFRKNLPVLLSVISFIFKKIFFAERLCWPVEKVQLNNSDPLRHFIFIIKILFSSRTHSPLCLARHSENKYKKHRNKVLRVLPVFSLSLSLVVCLTVNKIWNNIFWNQQKKSVSKMVEVRSFP